MKFHNKISKAIFTGQLLQTKERNRVICQRQYGFYTTDRNAASLTLKRRFSRASLGTLFQALAAENLKEVCPHLVSTCGRSNNVGSLKD